MVRSPAVAFLQMFYRQFLALKVYSNKLLILYSYFGFLLQTLLGVTCGSWMGICTTKAYLSLLFQLSHYLIV